MKIKTDYLVIGSGLAGLSMAVKAAECGKVILITKSELHEFKTAQERKISDAYVPVEEDLDLLINETILIGNGLCKDELVREVLSNTTAVTRELIDWGAKFKNIRLNNNGKSNKIGGSFIHQYAENTGHEIQRVLLGKIKDNPNITVYNYHFAIDLITQHHLGRPVTRFNSDTECYGAYVLDMENGKINTFLAKSTFLATGGAGNLYMNTINTPTISGDGIAMVYRAKGLVDNMEFVKFHPMVLFNYNDKPDMPVPYSLIEEGAKLRTIAGNEFLHKYKIREDLTQGDFIAQAMDHELKLSGEDYALLDCTGMDKNKLLTGFSEFLDHCMNSKLDPVKDFVPVTPAAQYFCGGICVDNNARASIKNLYAVGECSNTGLHGGNVLAFNSLIEALFFADKAIKDAAEKPGMQTINEPVPDWNDKGTKHPEEMILITQNLKEVKRIMSIYVGIARSEVRLKRAFNRLWVIYSETEELYKKSTLSKPLCELRNLINIGYLVIKQGASRKKSLGLHYMVP